MTADSKIAAPSTSSTGVLPSGETARNQDGLLARSMSRRSKGRPFSASTMAARCTYGHKACDTSTNLEFCDGPLT